MPRATARREKWTLSFDAELKAFLIKAARRRRIYPVSLLEEIVKEKSNPAWQRFGILVDTDVLEALARFRLIPVSRVIAETYSRVRLGSPGLAREDALIAATAISPLTRPRG